MDKGKNTDKGFDKLRSKFAKKNDNGEFAFSKSETLRTIVKLYIKTLRYTQSIQIFKAIYNDFLLC